MAALQAVQPAETPDPASPPEVLAQFLAEQRRLQQQLASLQGTRDLARLDELASITAKLNHIDGLMPELEEEAAQYERDTRLAAARARVQPLWQVQAERKVAARASIAAACKAITAGVEDYGLAHGNQLALLDQVGLHRGEYGGMVAQLIQCLHAAISLAGGAPEWQGKLSAFDPPGCSPVLPISQIM